MKISKEILQEWESVKEHGDTKAISKLLKMTPQNTSKLLSSGEGSVAQLGKIRKFFNARKKEINKIMEDQD